jgi:predicted nucleotidyltransferase
MNLRRAGVFTVEERNRISDRILEIAKSEERVVAAAVVGSLATDEGDRWSDLDLTFGITPENQTLDVLDRLTTPLVREFMPFLCSTCLTGKAYFGFCCCRDVFRSTFRLRQPPVSVPMGRNSESFLATTARNQPSRLCLQSSCSGTPPITRRGRAFV